MVPSIHQGGGVPAVARFVKDVVASSEEYELHVFSLATGARDGCSVRLLSPQSWTKGVSSQAGVWDGVPYTHIGAWACELEFQRYRPRRELTNQLAGCDLVHVVAGTPAWALAAQGCGKPVIAHVATRALVERQSKERAEAGALGLWRKSMTRITNRLDDRALRSVDAVLVMNSWMHAYASRVRRSSWNVEYGQPGVDTELFRPAADRLRRGADRYILSVSRFDDPRKNISLLLQAFRLLVGRMERPPYLRLAGAADPGRSFWDEVRSSGLAPLVQFFPRPTRSELVAHYQGASCFVLPSDEEGFGMVLIEAMACGVPVISTKSGGPESIVTAGSEGFLTQVGHAVEMAARIEQLTKDLEINVEMGTRARKTVEQRFSTRAAASACMRLYQRIQRTGRV